MELVGSLLTIFVGWIVLQAILDMAGRGAVVAGRAVKKVITGKETYFGPAELRVDDGLIPDSTFKTKEIMFRGRIPVVTSTNVSYVISVFDVTEGDQNLKPVLSLVDAAQEKNTIAYQVSGQIGDVDIGISFIDWVKIGNTVKNETDLLVLNTNKANKVLKWKTRLSVNDAVKLTIHWYKEFYSNKSNKALMINLTKNQILDYHKKFKI